MVRPAPAAAIWVASVERLDAARAELDRAAAELHAIAFSDIGDYFGEGFRPLPLSEVPPAARKALKTHRVTRRTRRDGSVSETVVVRLHDKHKALACLARLYGLPG
jgi:hypothetical protein